MRGREWGFITFIDFVLIVTAELDISIGSKARHDSGQKMARGMYKTKEEVERPPVWDHPCNLTRTAVKISFPAMKSEVFVNFLGYREPNLKYVMRCKGVCGEDKSQTACVATKVGQKKVQMMIKSHLQGRDEKERWKEVMLEEHTECGCGCAYASADQCVDRFNAQTCECECSSLVWGAERESCKAREGHHWDERFCVCRNNNKVVTTRQVEERSVSDCPFPSYPPSYRLDILDIASYIILGSSATLAFFLSITTYYYRRKYKRLLSQEKEKDHKTKYKKIDRNEVERQNHILPSKKSRSAAVWRHPNKSHSSHRVTSSHCNGFSQLSHHQQEYQEAAMGMDLSDLGGGGLYHEEYDEHGVKIEKPMSDAELLSRYLG